MVHTSAPHPRRLNYQRVPLLVNQVQTRRQCVILDEQVALEDDSMFDGRDEAFLTATPLAYAHSDYSMIGSSGLVLVQRFHDRIASMPPGCIRLLSFEDLVC